MLSKLLLLTVIAAGLAQAQTTTNTSTSHDLRPYRRVIQPQPPLEMRKRILLYYDMEGLAGQSDWRSFFFRYQEAYSQGQAFLVADVNAVIAGLFEGGATEVHVVDSHGSGNPQPDLPVDKLDPRVKPVVRNAPFESYTALVEPDRYDAVVAVGMHGKTGNGGFASHTYGLGKEIILNGRALSETELIAYSWGRVGVPVIFVSGDDRAQLDLDELPWIEYVAVKKSLSTTAVELRPLAEAHRELRQTARRAVLNLDKAKAAVLNEPIRAALRVRPPASLTVLDGVPGITYADEQVTFIAKNFESAYKGIESLIRVSDLAFPEVLYRVIRQRQDAREIFDPYVEALIRQGLESGTAERPPSHAASKPALRQHLVSNSASALLIRPLTISQ